MPTSPLADRRFPPVKNSLPPECVRCEGNKETKADHPMTMHHAIYPDGTLSADVYNLPRAKHHTVVLAETEGRNDRRQRAVLTPLVRVFRLHGNQQSLSPWAKPRGKTGILFSHFFAIIGNGVPIWQKLWAEVDSPQAWGALGLNRAG